MLKWQLSHSLTLCASFPEIAIAWSQSPNPSCLTTSVRKTATTTTTTEGKLENTEMCVNFF